MRIKAGHTMSPKLPTILRTRLSHPIYPGRKVVFSKNIDGVEPTERHEKLRVFPTAISRRSSFTPFIGGFEMAGKLLEFLFD